METVIQSLLGLSCLFLACLGIKTMFSPKSMVEILDIEIETAAGLNTVRGFLGGLFIGSSTLLAAGLITANTTFILSVAITMSAVVIGRCVGIVIDGYNKKVLFPLAAEIIMTAAFIAAYTQLGAV
ncbi:DUF4345 family protein [Psychromonas aquimarina]|uniref:DUF4345 family protein n=1 Tax=Psychromonas aquimarina TaxID=444919 RepID=UPI000686C289|nr:DUF4345 family protein [Psychromonas aquimarina]